MITSQWVTMTVADALNKMRQRISENIDSLGLRASGCTQASMHVEETDGGGILWGRKYFQGLEEGSAPAPRGRWFQAVIKQWIIDKRIAVDTSRYRDADKALEGAAWAIATTIIRHGTVTYRRGGRKDVYTPVLTQGVEELRKTLAVEVRRSLVDELNKA